MSNYVIEHAKMSDFAIIESVYATARKFMKETGNPTQWGDTYPECELLENDIQNNNLYVVKAEEEIIGAFMFSLQVDQCYNVIENGSWRFDRKYGVIHRLASNGKKKGVFGAVLEFALTQSDYIRIDTHKQNKVMQSVLAKHGFVPCGKVYMLNGSPRIGYDYLNE